MGRKQVLVQLDEKLLAALDEAAAVAGVSRSEMIRQAARMYLDAAHEEELDRQVEEAYRRIPDGTQWDDYYAQLAREHREGDAEAR
ncbi:MAG: ribbon-helix-helix protein, CopG family [Actinomycetota bacterium]|nr:ribbon-helix-helix protein, CopG family [Actinomycetota bacterium]